MRFFLKSIVFVFVLFLFIGCGSGGDGEGAGSVIANPDQNTTDDNTTTTPTNPLTTLNLELNATSLNLGEKASIVATGTFKDNTFKEVNDQVEWIITPQGSVGINGTTLTTLKDNNTTLRAKVGNVVSNAINLEIYWEVNGHKLPPEPDEALNSSTLLGVDANNNDVRDDVERKVYATYKKAIDRAVMMQAFVVVQKMLADPDLINNAREWATKDIKSIDCMRYLYLYRNQDQIDKIAEIINEWQFTNKERVRLYIEYNNALSGGVYTINEPKLQDCEFDVNNTLEMDK